MSNKGIASLLFTIMLEVIGGICFVKTLHVNDVQNLQVIQSIDGDITELQQAELDMQKTIAKYK